MTYTFSVTNSIPEMKPVRDAQKLGCCSNGRHAALLALRLLGLLPVWFVQPGGHLWCAVLTGQSVVDRVQHVCSLRQPAHVRVQSDRSVPEGGTYGWFYANRLVEDLAPGVRMVPKHPTCSVSIFRSMLRLGHLRVFRCGDPIYGYWQHPRAIVFNGFFVVINYFYMAIASGAVDLFCCYPHPDGQRSLQTAPEVICG